MNDKDKLYIRSTQSGGKSCQTVMPMFDILAYAEKHNLKSWIENGRVITETKTYPFHQTIYLPVSVRA